MPSVRAEVLWARADDAELATVSAQTLQDVSGAPSPCLTWLLTHSLTVQTLAGNDEDNFGEINGSHDMTTDFDNSVKYAIAIESSDHEAGREMPNQQVGPQCVGCTFLCDWSADNPALAVMLTKAPRWTITAPTPPLIVASRPAPTATTAPTMLPSPSPSSSASALTTSPAIS